MLTVRGSKSDYRIWFCQTALITHVNSVRRKKMFHPTLLSHTRGNDSFSQSARGLCANLQNHFVTGGLVIFLSTATVTVQFAVCSGATEDRRHETRQTRARRSLLKSSPRVRRSANIKWSPLYHFSLPPFRERRRSLCQDRYYLRHYPPSCSHSYLSWLNCKGREMRQRGLRTVRRSFSQM